MAGLGSRFANEGFDIPKPLIKFQDQHLIEHSVSTLDIEGKYIFITRKFNDPNHNKELSALLKKIKPNSIEIIIDRNTSGATETALFAKKYINNDSPLLITNCDQRTSWNSKEYIDFIKSDIDGSIVTYTSSNPKNSFAEIENNFVSKIVEKNPISNIALVGIHHWAKGNTFINSAGKLLSKFKSDNKKECYISETYNYLIDEGFKIKNYHIGDNEYIPLGTPYDLKIYEGKIKEFYTKKPKTIFCDIDGTILQHCHRFSDLKDIEPKTLPGVLKKFNQWDSQGHKIILCTARKESARGMTESHLRQLGLCWDTLLMGVTSGERILINDKLNKRDKDRAVSVNLLTNKGFKSFSWNEIGL